jgi:hypothetical protein
MKNITISLPDEVYRQARIKAAEQDTSVTALVRNYLINLGNEESEFERRKRLQTEVLGSITEFRAGDRVTREEVYQRDAIR